MADGAGPVCRQGVINGFVRELVLEDVVMEGITGDKVTGVQ